MKVYPKKLLMLFIFIISVIVGSIIYSSFFTKTNEKPTGYQQKVELKSVNEGENKSFLFDRYQIGDVITISDPKSLSCSDRYERNIDDVFVSKTGSQLDDLRILDFVKGKNIASESLLLGGSEYNKIDSIIFCTSTSGNIIVYEYFSGGGGSNNLTYIDWLSINGLLNTSRIIENKKGAYFNCELPIAIDNRMNFYLGCGGESHRVIYKINLSSGIQSTLFELR